MTNLPSIQTQPIHDYPTLYVTAPDAPLPIMITISNKGDRMVQGDTDKIARIALNGMQIVISNDGSAMWVLNKNNNIWTYVGAFLPEFLLVSVLYPLAQNVTKTDFDSKIAKFLERVAQRMVAIIRGENKYKNGYFNNMTDNAYNYLGNYAYFANGVFNLDTMQLEPLRPEHYRTDETILPRPISAEPVTKEKIENNQIWQAVNFFTDKGSEQAFCEYLGSCFFENKREAVHMQIVVSNTTKNGGNGKTILMSKIIGNPLFGSMYTELSSHRTFNNKGDFNTALLVGKQLIFVDELNPYDIEAETFKQQITATRLKVNEKNKAEYDARFGGHFAGASNNVFKVRDSSNGTMRRIMIVIFDKQVTQGKDKVEFMKRFNPDYSDEMRNALDSPEVCAEFIRWCVEQYASVLAKRAEEDADEFVWTQSEEAREYRNTIERTKTKTIDIAYNSGLFEYTGDDGDLIEIKLFTDGVLLANRYDTDDKARILRKTVLEDMRDFMYNGGKRSRIKNVCSNMMQHHPDDFNKSASPRVYVQGFRLAHTDLDSDLEASWFEIIKKHLGKRTIMEEIFDISVSPDEVF